MSQKMVTYYRFSKPVKSKHFNVPGKNVMHAETIFSLFNHN